MWVEDLLRPAQISSVLNDKQAFQEGGITWFYMRSFLGGWEVGKGRKTIVFHSSVIADQTSPENITDTWTLTVVISAKVNC